MGRSIWLLLISMAFGIACAKHEPLTKDQAVELIQSAPAWKQPLEPSLYVDPSFRPAPSTKREVLRLEGLTVKDDGPGGMAGQTATGSFTWRWTEGYMQGKTFRSRVKLNNNGSGWRVYDDELSKALAASERGDID